jgi:hypothetical protein
MISSPAAPGLPHLYSALTECGYRDGPRLMPGTAAAIWRAIDALRARGEGREEIPILEQVAVQVHVLRQRLDRLDDNVRGDVEPRFRIAELTRAWLGVARLMFDPAALQDRRADAREEQPRPARIRF